MTNNFELLPNEILLKIFKYTRGIDACRGFHQLNHRIESILRSIPLRVNISLLEDSKHHALRPYAMQIEALYITFPATLPYNTKTTCRIDLCPFVQLRSLTLLCDTDEQQANQLCTQPFQHLTYLHLESFHASVLKGSYQRLMERIFSNGFPALRVCHLPRAMCPRNIVSPSSPAIHAVSLKQSTFHVLAEILACTPNATHFSVKNLDGGQQIPLLSEPLTHLELKGGTDLSLRSVQYILSKLFKLKQLSISTICCYETLDPLKEDLSILDDIVSTKLPDPSAFHCCIEVFVNEFSIEEVVQLLQSFPALNHIRQQPLSSSYGCASNIGFVLSCE